MALDSSPVKLFVIDRADAYNLYHWLVYILGAMVVLLPSQTWPTADYHVLLKRIDNIADLAGFQDLALTALIMPQQIHYSEAAVKQAYPDTTFQRVYPAELIAQQCDRYYDLPQDHSGSQPTRQAFEIVSQAILASVLKNQPIITPSPRIYLSRRDCGNYFCPTHNHLVRRTVLNEAELETALAKLGFVTIVTHNLTFAQQVLLFHQASVVVSAHGAGLTNLLFCQPGTVVVEFSPDPSRNRHFRQISHFKQLNYTCLHCPARDYMDNMMVDVDQTIKALAEAGVV